MADKKVIVQVASLGKSFQAFDMEKVQQLKQALVEEQKNYERDRMGYEDKIARLNREMEWVLRFAPSVDDSSDEERREIMHAAAHG